MEGPSSPTPHRFNVRVYGLLIDEIRQAVLISKEKYSGIRMTKFPGGGLEFGEGIAEALKREFREELGIEVIVGDLYYVNDFLQISAFNPADQLVSIDYRVSLPEDISLPDSPIPPDPDLQDKLSFHWEALGAISSTKFSFPVDKVVADKLSGISVR